MQVDGAARVLEWPIRSISYAPCAELNWRHRASGMAQIVKMQLGKATLPGPVPELAEVGPAKPPALGSDEDGPTVASLREALQVPGALRSRRAQGGGLCLLQQPGRRPRRRSWAGSVAEPVGAGRRAGLVAERVGEPVGVCGLVWVLAWWQSPTSLVVGGGPDLAQFGAGDGAADGDVDVRDEASLGFDGGDVLEVVADQAAQVLDEPVEQRGEVQRVPGGPGVVVGAGVGRGPVAGHLAVGRAGQRDEQRRPEKPAVRGGVGFADHAVTDLAAGKRRGIVPAPGGPVTAGLAGRTVPRIPASVICSSRSPICSSRSVVSRPAAARVSRSAWASARS